MIFSSPLPEVDLPQGDLSTVILSRADELQDQTALVDGPSGRSLTFAELKAHIRHFATGLQQRGFKQGDVFAIFCPNVPEYAVAFLGVASAGGINTTVNSLYSTDELIHQFKDSGARFLLTVAPFLDRALPAVEACGIEEVFVLGEAEGCTPYAELLANDGKLQEVKINPDKDLVVLPYSSGTTGLSKGVMLTHSNLVANMVLTLAVNDVDETDSTIAVLPFFHIYGMVLILCLALYRGAKLITMPRFELDQFLELIQQHRATFLNLVPPLVLALAKQPMVDDYDLTSIKRISCGAAPLGEELQKACAKRLNCVIYQGYGLTEVSGASHICKAEESAKYPGSVGYGIPNTESKFVDTKTGAELGRNERGEVCIRGPHVMVGYLNNPEATAACIDSDGWFHTGDVGYIDDNDIFYIVDRVKELIKYKGYQVAPAELEALLVSNPAIADAAVIPSPDEVAGEVPKAFIVRKSDISEEEIMQFVADHVAPHKKVRLLEFVDEIPKSASGKILRRFLVEKERERLAS